MFLLLLFLHQLINVLSDHTGVLHSANNTRVVLRGGSLWREPTQGCRIWPKNRLHFGTRPKVMGKVQIPVLVFELVGELLQPRSLFPAVRDALDCEALR